MTMKVVNGNNPDRMKFLRTFYNKEGRIWEFRWSEREYFAEWKNHTLTLLRDFETNELVGFQIWT